MVFLVLVLMTPGLIVGVGFAHLFCSSALSLAPKLELESHQGFSRSNAASAVDIDLLSLGYRKECAHPELDPHVAVVAVQKHEMPRIDVFPLFENDHRFADF
jgi:hypothetical protein